MDQQTNTAEGDAIANIIDHVSNLSLLLLSGYARCMLVAVQDVLAAYENMPDDQKSAALSLSEHALLTTSTDAPVWTREGDALAASRSKGCALRGIADFRAAFAV